MKLVKENIHFERGLNPKISMGTGTKPKMIETIDNHLEKLDFLLTNINDDIHFYKLLSVSKFSNILYVGKLKLQRNKVLRTIKKLEKIREKLSLKESQNFERGQSPKEAMKIGVKYYLKKLYDELETNSNCPWAITLNKTKMILTAVSNDSIAPENFWENGMDNFEWDKVKVFSHFIANFTATIIGSELHISQSFSNPDIPNFKFTYKKKLEINIKDTQDTALTIENEYILYPLSDAIMQAREIATKNYLKR